MRKGKCGELEVVFPYNEEYIAKVKEIHGRKWDKDNKKWLIPDCKESFEQLLKLFSEGEVVIDKSIYDLDESVEAEADNSSEQLLQMMRDRLKLRGYSPKTIKSYMSHLRLFLKYCGKNADIINEGDINKYLLFLLEEQKTSHSYVNQAVNSIKFFCNQVLGKEQIIINMIRPKKENKLPEVLSQKDILRVLDSVNNIKHKAILFLIYSAGLRVGEAVRLRITDIDSERMLIHIVQGKGRKDRYTVLSQVALETLREYVKQYRPEKWMFLGEDPNSHITERTVQKVFETAKDKAGIQKKVSVHTLRHSFATHLLEGGVDLRYIQELLGHQSSTTTEIYTHVTEKSIQSIQSPLDKIMIRKS
ncbi:MAG: site-specific tyrosine recombinase/integron integrase [Clostridia bacterium]